jgi:hypothetical protein
MTFTVPAFFLHFAKHPFRILDAIFDPPLPAVVKFAIVFVGTLSTSWLATLWLRRNPLVARMI